MAKRASFLKRGVLSFCVLLLVVGGGCVGFSMVGRFEDVVSWFEIVVNPFAVVLVLMREVGGC